MAEPVAPVVGWSNEIDSVLGGDLTAALACATPAGGCVVMAVGPLGLRDRDNGTVMFTTSLGVGRKLERIRAEPRVALAYHTRQHGTATSSAFVLVQGRATILMHPDQPIVDNVLRNGGQLMGPMPEHAFWRWWLREYASVRVIVSVTTDTITTWPDLHCAGPQTVIGQPRNMVVPDQPPPSRGTSPRVSVARATRRVDRHPHQLLAYLDADGAPTVAPVRVAGTDDAGLILRAPSGVIPTGKRRAGLLAHTYRPKLLGVSTRYLTGWLIATDDDHIRYAPHTNKGYTGPSNKTLLLLLNGGMTKLGVRRAARRGKITEWPTPLI